MEQEGRGIIWLLFIFVLSTILQLRGDEMGKNTNQTDGNVTLPMIIGGKDNVEENSNTYTEVAVNQRKGKGKRVHINNKKEYRIGEFAQCVDRRSRCRGMRLDCPLHCGGPCYYDCKFMCKAHCRRP
ncbi:hypothetical protein ACFE04_011545 [Oxalis oulophora]